MFLVPQFLPVTIWLATQKKTTAEPECTKTWRQQEKGWSVGNAWSWAGPFGEILRTD